MSGNFFPKLSKFCKQKIRKFHQLFSKSKKTIICKQISPNCYIDPNSAKFSLKTPKKLPFYLKQALFFKIYGSFGVENLEFYVPNFPIFLELAHLGLSPSQKGNLITTNTRVIQGTKSLKTYRRIIEIRDELGGP